MYVLYRRFTLPSMVNPSVSVQTAECKFYQMKKNDEKNTKYVCSRVSPNEWHIDVSDNNKLSKTTCVERGGNDRVRERETTEFSNKKGKKRFLSINSGSKNGLFCLLSLAREIDIIYCIFSSFSSLFRCST